MSDMILGASRATIEARVAFLLPPTNNPGEAVIDEDAIALDGNGDYIVAIEFNNRLGKLIHGVTLRIPREMVV